MKQLSLVLVTAAAAALTALAIACGGTRPTFSSSASGTGKIEVHVSAGSPIAGATVTVYAIHDADGRVNAAVGDAGVIGSGGPTDSTGVATITLSMQDYSGPLQVVASGSNLSYVDPCSPASSGSAGVAIQIPATFALSSFFPSYAAGTTLTLPVTIVSTLADREALAFLQGRHPLHPGTTTLSTALTDRDRLFVQHITSSASAWDPASFRTTVPAALGDGPQTFNDSALASLFDVGLNALAHRIAPQAGYGDGSTVINAITLAQLLAEDLAADATFDGKGAGGAQLETSGSSPVSLDAQTLRLPFASALDEFIYTPALNKSGITRVDLSNAGVYTSITNDESDLFGAPAVGTFVLDRIPPSVAFGTLPAATNSPLAVPVHVTDTGGGIASVWVQLNGAQLVQASATSTAGLYQASPVTLRAGPNTLVAWAVDDAQTSGQGQPSPATATAQLVFDNSRPAPTYLDQFASYYDERGLTVATVGNVAVVPVQYVCSTAVHGCTKTAIPADRGISKVATRLSWITQPTAAVLEVANPDNIPLLRWKVPFNSATDAPITRATYSVAVSCTAGCSYPVVTGDLWPSAATSTDAVLFDLPVASNLIPALTSLPSAATLAVTVTFTDAAGNVGADAVSVPFHLLGPPLAVVPDSSYLTSSGSLASFTLSAGNYASMWGRSGLGVYHYTVSNPHAQPVAIPYPTATWSNRETWRAHRQQGYWWFSQAGCNASPGGCGTSASEGCSTCFCPYYACLDQWPACASFPYGCSDNGGGASRYLQRVLQPYSGGVRIGPLDCRSGSALPPLCGDWGVKTAGTSTVYSRFQYQGHEMNGSPIPGNYIIPAATSGTGSPAVVDVRFFVVSTTRTNQTDPQPSPSCAITGVPRLPSVAIAHFYDYLAGSSDRRGCDNTWVFRTTHYYDYQSPDEIHDDITGSWSITSKMLDVGSNPLGDPAPQQVMSLNYQIPHN